ncbi:MAG: DUF4377 domain-containing protein [Bacteroidales bacterium]
MKLKLFLFMFVAILASCTSQKQSASEQSEVLLINSSLVDCHGVGPMKCYQVKYPDQQGQTDAWETMYTQIEGFDYEPGYVYKLKVKKEILDKKDLPQDASSIRYTLISVVSKTRDTK